MSTVIQAAPHKKYSRGVKQGNAERKTRKTAILEDSDHNVNPKSQKTGRHAKKNYLAATGSHIRAIPAVVGIFLLLAFTGIAIRYILVTLHRNQLNTLHEQLKSEHTKLKMHYNQLMEACGYFTGFLSPTDNPNTTSSVFDNGLLANNGSQLDDGFNKTISNATEKEDSCSEGWLKVGCNCYYVFTESTGLQKIKADCQGSGGTLMVINSREKERILRGETSEEALQCG